MGDPEEIQDGPVGNEPEELGAAGPWHNVPRPSTDALLTPSAQVADPPRMPAVVKFGGLALVALLLLMAGWLGLTLGGSGGGVVSPTPGIDESAWPLAPPVTLGNLVQGATATDPGDRHIVSADYSDGSAKVVLQLSRPEDDLTRYLQDAGVENTTPVEDATCGISMDNGVPVCARVVDGTAIAVAGLTEQSFTTLTSLVDSFYEALR
ncbi:hypothetical protein [Tessaracoccus sp.]